MIGEKAADAILEAAKTTPRHSTPRPPSQRDVHV
jgi:hypothetical protein